MAEGDFCWEWRKGTFVGNGERGLLSEMTGRGVGNDGRGLLSGMTKGGSFVGNDRRDVGNGGRGPFVRNDRRGPFCMGERDADAVLDENHEANGFVPADGRNPAAPFPLFLVDISIDLFL